MYLPSLASKPIPWLPVHMRGRRGVAPGRGATRGGGGCAGAARVAPPAAPRVTRTPAAVESCTTTHGAQRGRADTPGQCHEDSYVVH